jgi:WD40 repeat protein/serine/threonine protein kinase
MPSRPPSSNNSDGNPPVRVPDHDLLRRIGRGAYGEVWLARSVPGAYRAVKIVRKSSPELGRSYEREFEGIRRYEKISRGHEGLVDVLHVGLVPSGECFYYVMELADDVQTAIPLANSASPDSYRPKTLRDLRKDEGRLPITRCLDIAARLAGALSQIHNAGLVHRDIKPSNVIFVEGQPKLADIGLLASASEDCSFVGTEGFVAPEGPGTVQADIYSFGKLLYEMATGLDRTEFPKLPALPAVSKEEMEEFAELNEVLLRACDRKPENRYSSADELRRELLFLQGGRSVRKLRLLERRASVARKVSLITAGAALVAITAYFGSFRQFQRAQEAERKARATVESLQLSNSEDYFRRDDSSTALAMLAHLVRQNPTNRVAVERLLAALTWRNFTLPRIEPILTSGRPRMALFNRNDSELVTATFDGVLQTWDTATGRQLATNKFLDGRISWIDLSQDGRLVAVAGSGYSAIVDASTLQPTVPLMKPTTNRVASVHFSPNQKWLISAGTDGTTRLWDVQTGRQVGLDIRTRSSIRHATFSPDSSKVAAGLRNGEIRLWEVPSGKALDIVLRHKSIVWKVQFSPDGKLIATASDDHEARLWDASTGALFAVLPHKNCVVDVNFSPDGTKVVTASEDLTAVIWEVATGKPIGNPLRHRNWIRQANFSPDGQRVVTSSEDNTARLWDAETTEPIVEPMRHPTEVVHSAFSHSGKALATSVSAAAGEEVWIWDVATQGARGLPLLTRDQANAAEFSPDGQWLAVACRSGAVRIWKRADYQGKEELLSHDREVRLLAFSPNGEKLVAVHERDAVIWDLRTRTRIDMPIAHDGMIHSIEFSSDNRRILSASADGTAGLWDADTGARLQQFPPQMPTRNPIASATSALSNARFSPDNTMVVTASRNKFATVWNAETGVKIAELQHDHWVTHAEFSPDNKTVLTSSIDRSANVWSIASATPLTPPLTHDSDIKTAHFSADGAKVITTSMDWTARIWDARTGAPLSELLRHEGPATVASFSPTSNYAITGADDGIVRLWDATSGVALNDGFKHSSEIVSASFSPDGELLMVVPTKGDVTVYELLAPVYPAPSWLADLGEAVAGQRLSPGGKLERTSPRRFFELRREMMRKNVRGFYARWAMWFLQETDKRTISPRAKTTVSEYARRKIEMNTIADLREALFLLPTSAIAHGRLARLYSDDESAPSSRRLQLAAWHLAHALALDPENQELLAIKSRIEARRLRSETVKQSPSP